MIPPLHAGDVHVWSARLTSLAQARPSCAKVLDADERRRAERFRLRRDRRRFVLTHGLLRLLLGAYCAEPPETLRFVTGVWGKPALGTAARALDFNLSHSGDRALFAIAHRPVGIDLERRSRSVAIDEVASSVFSPRERGELATLPAQRRTAGFFAAWTRKEAYIKALGEGFNRDLATFDVPVDPAEAPCIVADRLDPSARRRWSLLDLPVGGGYSAALAALGAGWRALVFELDAEAIVGLRRSC